MAELQFPDPNVINPWVDLNDIVWEYDGDGWINKVIPVSTINICIDDNEIGGIWGDLIGAVNSSNTQYIVSKKSYITGTLEVLLDGQDQRSSNIIETTPGSGIFNLNSAPITGMYIKARYQYNDLPIIAPNSVLDGDGNPVLDSYGNPIYYPI